MDETLSELLDRQKTETTVTTTRGLMSKADLDREVVVFEDDHELTQAIEYRDKETGELLHRSVHVQLKEGVLAAGHAASTL